MPKARATSGNTSFKEQAFPPSPLAETLQTGSPRDRGTLGYMIILIPGQLLGHVSFGSFADLKSMF